jgi:hypothetical protein
MSKRNRCCTLHQAASRFLDYWLVMRQLLTQRVIEQII